MTTSINGLNQYLTHTLGTASDFIPSYGLTAIDIAFLDTNESAAQAAYQSAKMAIVAGTDATGLANDATVYTATVTVDGADNAIAIAGNAAQTITDLVTELNADLTGATAAINGANITITSTATDVSASVSIVDVDLFAAVTGFYDVSDAIAGGLQGYLQLNDDATTGQPAWNKFKFSINTFDTSSKAAVIAAGTGLADDAMSAAYTEGEQDAVLNAVNALLK